MSALQKQLIEYGWSEPWAAFAAVVAGFVGALLVAEIFRIVAQHVLLKLARPGQQWEESLKEHSVFRSVAWLMAVALTQALVLPFLEYWPEVRDAFETLTNGLMVLLLATSFNRVIAATVGALELRGVADQRIPFKVLGQALQIVVWCYAAVVFASVISHRDVAFLLTGMTAVGSLLVYVFRDLILGWVAGIQIAGNDLARYGDWITVPNRGADGEVIDIALTTIKVRNWDKTISTIPSYALVSEGFRNWRGMAESGGRRINRSLFIDAASIRLCDQAMIERLRGDSAIQEVFDIQSSGHSGQKVDSPDPLLNPGPTNLSCYRRWLQAWLDQQPLIHDDMPCMVRELESAGRGIPVQIYAFSREQRWPLYERLQADICDFALAVLPHFDLKLFQEPSGADIHAAGTGGVKNRSV